MRITRRHFLQVGIAAGLMLTASHAMKTRADTGPSAIGSLDLKALDNRDAACIAALAAVILTGSLPAEASARQVAINEVVEAFDRTIMGLSAPIQAEVQQLLALLTLGITRRFVVGIAAEWPDAAEADVQAFLARWRHSRIALLQQSYQALVRLMLACWYANPLSWGAIGYRGPPFAKELGLQ